MTAALRGWHRCPGVHAGRPQVHAPPVRPKWRIVRFHAVQSPRSSQHTAEVPAAGAPLGSTTDLPRPRARQRARPQNDQLWLPAQSPDHGFHHRDTGDRSSPSDRDEPRPRASRCACRSRTRAAASRTRSECRCRRTRSPPSPPHGPRSSKRRSPLPASRSRPGTESLPGATRSGGVAVHRRDWGDGVDPVRLLQRGA
jgi:hypothetical protein